MLGQLLTVAVVLVGALHSSSAAVHCQPGDEGCAKCQASCDAIPLTALPECCEAFSACCPTYSQACGHCSANAAIDSHFPEYCCASFTDCCDLVPGLNVVAGFNAKQGSKIPSKDAPAKGIQKHPRSTSPDEPQPEPEPAADAASTSDAANVSEAAPLAPLTRADAATSSQPAAPEGDTRTFKPVVIPRPAQENTPDLEMEARSPVAAVSRGRGRTRASVSTGTASDTVTVPVLVSGKLSSPTVSRTPQVATGRGADRTSAPVSPARGGDDSDVSQSSSQTRSRQATIVSRRNRPTEADRKVIAAASLDRKGRITSRGRVA